MPSIERRWRLLFVASALIALILPLSFFGPWLFFFVQGAPLSSPLSLLDLSTFLTLITFLGVAFWLWRLACRGRAHEQARRRALAGDVLAIPAADIALDTSDEAPAATQLPLVVSWHLAHTGCRATLWRTTVVLLAILMGFAAIIGVMLLLLLRFRLDQPLIVLGTFVALSLAGIGLISLLIRRLSRPTGSVAYTIIADDQGVTWRRPAKADLLIPWDQARLLEVWAGDLHTGHQHWHGYTLYGPGVRVEWQEYPASYIQAAPDGIARDELIQRQRALLALIHARTSLTPRTFDDAFQVKDASIPPRRFSLSGTAFALAIAAALLFAAVAALALPLTRYPLLNLYVAITIGPIGLTILVIFFQTLVSSPDTPASRTPPAPPLPPAPPIALGDPGPAVALSHTLTLRSRLLGLFGGLLAAVDLVAAARGFIGDASPGHPSIFSTAGLRLLAAVIVALPAFFVLMLAWADVFKRATTLQASATGLSERAGNKETMITWHETEAVTARVKHGTYTSFAVTTRDSDTSIGWPARATHARRDAPGLTISGAELAALVVARSGRALTIAADGRGRAPATR